MSGTWRSMAVLGMLVSVALFARPAESQRRIPLPDAGVPESLGVNIHFTDGKPGEVDQLAAAGFRWIRMDFFWGGIERVRGKYDFSAYDRLMASLKPHGIRPIFILDYGNDLYEQGSPRSPEAREAFGRFAAAAVTHFKGRGVLWEMWNEPNGGFWKPKANVGEYIALALETGKAIRKAAPEEWFIGPGVSGMDFSFMESCFRAGLLEYWDAVSFHPYRSSPPETAAADFTHTRALIAQYAPKGRSIPILSSEWGYSELYPGLNLEKQSRYIAREFLSNLANGLIVSIWYDWHDDGTNPKEEEHHFGTVYPDYKPKPTYLSAKTLSGALGGLRFNKRLALSSESDYCLLFSAGSRTVLAAWTTATTPHEVTLPASAGRFTRTGYLGDTDSIGADSAGIKILLTDAPQYLTPAAPNRLLQLAAQWHAAPTALWVGESPADAVPLMLLAEFDAGAAAIPQGTVELTDVTHLGKSLASWPVGRRGAAPAGLANTQLVSRGEEAARLRATLRLPGVGEISQEVEVAPLHPLHITVTPPRAGAVSVRIENPTGAPFRGLLSLSGSAIESAPFDLKAGDTRATVDLPMAMGTESLPISVTLLEQHDGQAAGIVLKTNPVRFATIETFSEYTAGESLPAAGYALVPDGDPKVASHNTATVTAAPTGLPGGGAALKIDYQFADGWKFLRLAPNGDNRKPLEGRPHGLGVWVYGDGSNNVLNARFSDATGQTFQTSAGKLDWKGWRYLMFPLSGIGAGHWGGADDGSVHYPIRMDTDLLIDSADQRATSGAIYAADFRLVLDAVGDRP